MLAHAFLGATAHAARPRRHRNPLAPAQTPTASRLKKATWRLWATFRPAEDIRPASLHKWWNRARPDLAHYRRGPPPVQTPHPHRPPRGIPRALVRLPPPGRPPANRI